MTRYFVLSSSLSYLEHRNNKWSCRRHPATMRHLKDGSHVLKTMKQKIYIYVYICEMPETLMKSWSLDFNSLDFR